MALTLINTPFLLALPALILTRALLLPRAARRLQRLFAVPAGALGRRVDALLLHHLAEATVRAFLCDVRDRLDPAIRRRPLGARRGR